MEPGFLSPMATFQNIRVWRHLLIAGGILLGIGAFVVVRNWDTFALMYANATAMNEGRDVVEEIRRPEDLIGYLASHPEHASLVAYEIGAREEGIFFRADVQRPVANTSHLLLLAEYARLVETNQLAPDRQVPLDSLEIYALPGAGRSTHEQAIAHWRSEGVVRPDSTIAIRHVIKALSQFGDRAAADWFLTAAPGDSQTQSMAKRWNVDDSDGPLPSSGMYLSWIRQHASPPDSSTSTLQGRAGSHEAYTNRVYQLTQKLRRDSSFRTRERRQLERRGSRLSVRDQRTLAQSTYPKGTAADYADLLARSLKGSLGSSAVSEFVRREIASPVESDSLATIETVGTKVGAIPGIISFVGYIRYTGDRPPKVFSLLIEDLPIGLFYHIIQSGLDKGLQLRLLSDSDFFDRVKDRLSKDNMNREMEGRS